MDKDPFWVGVPEPMSKYEDGVGDFLDNTVGYFDEELEAYKLTMLIAIGFPFILVIGAILQFVLYRLYNRKFHPFKEMAKMKIKGKFNCP